MHPPPSVGRAETAPKAVPLSRRLRCARNRFKAYFKMPSNALQTPATVSKQRFEARRGRRDSSRARAAPLPAAQAEQHWLVEAIRLVSAACVMQDTELEKL